MKSGFTRLAHKLARIEARLDARGDGQQFHIPKKSGMRGLREATQAAMQAHQNAPPTPPPGDMPDKPLTALARLRADILAEQKRRAEWFSTISIASLGYEPVIEEAEEPEACPVPTMPDAPGPSN